MESRDVSESLAIPISKSPIKVRFVNYPFDNSSQPTEISSPEDMAASSNFSEVDMIYMANLPKSGTNYQKEWNKFTKFSNCDSN